MEIPRFEHQNLNSRIASADIGDAFQTFVHELLLPRHPQLHRFPGGGKDGGIDLIETADTCLVVECKVVGEDDDAKIEQRWKKVRGHLEEHLSDPKGPTKGQSQYGPWYSVDEPITEYVFSVSAAFSHEQQRRNLHKEISGYFHDLAKRRAHLSHLAALKVTIIDWNDLCDILRQRPHAVFRWFPRIRPKGFVPLDEAAEVGTFRSYLNNAKLPYYSLSEHLGTVPPPDEVAILNEDSLLDRFEDEAVTGLVINGKGGIGKSRLTLELGWKALKMGWTVMRVQNRLKGDALEMLAEKLTPETRALLLIDYIETQNDFSELVEDLNLLNDSGVARIRYVAACRTGYYHQAIAATGRHLPVDLSPPPGDAALQWFGGYRSQTVMWILGKAGIAITEQHRRVCHDLPILAVFMAYLQTSGRTEQLAELLAEAEFGRWVAKRVQLSFPARNVTRDLALLLPLFPMGDAAAARIQSTELSAVFDRLATDGWIEKVTPTVTESFIEWVTAHDVLSDQILLSYVRSVPHTSEAFIAELLAFAAEVNCLDSVIVSLQRNADSAPLNALPWVRIITDSLARSENEWLKVRDRLFRTTLLSEPEQIALLYTHKQLWVDAERETGFQNALGWRARWLAKTDGANIPELHKQELISCVLKAAPLADRSNFVITWGLRLAPQSLSDIALRWIGARPSLFQTHYLLVAWLECDLVTKSVAVFVQRWCQRYSKTFHLSFAAVAWLDAEGDKALVQEPIKGWLTVHKTDEQASHVYKSWLDAEGDKALVQEPIKGWLTVHKTDEQASHVYKSWLDAEGDKALVQEPIKDWLTVHKTDEQASHVYKSWLDAEGDKALVQEPIKDWLTVHKTELCAQFVYNAWLDAEGDKALVQEPIKGWLTVHKTDEQASHVYKSWLDAEGDKALVQEPIKGWLTVHKTDEQASHVYKSWLDAEGDKALVQEPIKDWLAVHKTELCAEFVYNAWLDAEGDKALVQEPIKDWLTVHKTELGAEFVYNAWLDAEGDKALVQEPIKGWLTVHKTDEQASHVYKSWLDAEGDKALVQEPIKDWLTVHKTDEQASHVYKSWLDAEGDKALVREPIKDWLAVHKTDEQASHVYKSWLDAEGDKALVQEPIKDWLAVHARDYDASFVIWAWLNAGGNPVELRKFIRLWLATQTSRADTSFVLIAWLVANGDRASVASDVEYCLLAKVNPKACARLAELWAP